MNIGIVTDTYRPRINGVVTSIDTFAYEFRKLGHSVYIFAPSFPHVPAEEHVYRFPSLYLFFDPEDRLALPWSRKVTKKIPDLKLDILHTQTPFTLGIAALRWARQNHIPLVHTYHTLFTAYTAHYLKFIPKDLGVEWTKRLSRAYCDRCQLVITPSPQMKQALLSYGVHSPVEVNPTGINLERLQNADGKAFRKNFGIKDEEKMLLFMGRIGREKNVPFLFRMLKLVLKEIPAVRLVVAGEGPAKQELVRLCSEMGIQGHVLFIGYMNKEDWANCYAAADLFTFASVTETQGLVVTEAMAVGTPVVAVGEMGVADIMRGDKGGLLTRLDEAEFSRAVIQLLLDQSLYEKKVKEALNWAKEWSSEAMGKKLLGHYQAVISEFKK